MKIKALKLSGFKSFVEPAELKIRDGLTGVVGPNGCGKSNLLEAIRWVMGESSAKSMRGGGMEDVIFAGTNTRPARNFAEVTLNAEVQNHQIASLVDTDTASDALEDLEVIRRIERGAGSAYRANARDVRAKDIALIFADAATGAHSPALVSQGRISNIIAAKPAQRREMLEEAAGISGLHVRRKDAEQKLRAAERNLERLDTILNDMEARSSHLKRQARAAEKYRKLTDAIARAEARLIFVRWQSAKIAADHANEEVKKANILVREAQHKHGDISTAHQVVTLELANDRAATMASRDALNDKNQALIKLQGQLERMHDQKAELEKQAQLITDDIGNEDKLTHDASDALSCLKEELSAIQIKITQNDEARPALSRQLEIIEDSDRSNDVALANAIAQHAKAEAELRVADAAVESCAAQIRRYEQMRLALLDESQALESEDVIRAARDQALRHMEILSKNIKSAISNIADNEAKRGVLEDDHVKKQSLYADVKAQLSALESEQSALQKSVTAQENNGVHKAIAHMKAHSGFEHALAAALGDDAEAQLGGESGRRWSSQNPVTKTQQPPIKNAICLADHVQAPDALMNRLSHIWVVDKDEGDILPVGHRVVTRNGIMRRWDGFISDNDGSISAQYLIRSNRLSKITDMLPDLISRCETTMHDIEECRESIHQAQQQLKNARSSRQDLEQKLRNTQREVDQSENALTQLRDKKKQIQEREKTVKSECEAAKATHAQAMVELAELTQTSDLEKNVDELRQKSETLRSHLMKVQTSLSSHDQHANAARERKAVIAAEIRGWQERASEADKRIAAMKERAKEINSILISLEGQPEKLTEHISQLETEKSTTEENLKINQNKEESSAVKLKEFEAILSHASETLSTAREARASAQAQAENQEQRRVEMGRISGERFECPPPLLPKKLEFNEADLCDTASESAALEKFQNDREHIGPVNLVAADELQTLEKEQADGRAESEELIQAIRQLRGSIGSLNREGRERLRAAFTAVDGHFRRLFSILFNGGTAHLELIDSDDPLEAGLEIMAQPPGKKLSSLTLLSGGEQALTAVALIFGLFLTNPAPICVLDEVDAPLDDANIERFCGLLDAMVKETDTRYLIVTHNAVTMSRMHRLYGVTMIEQGVSRLVSVDLGGATELLDNR